MAKQTAHGVRRPRSDGGAIFDAIHGIYGAMALPIAHRRGLFQLLEGKRLTAAEIGDALALPTRAAEALLAAVTSPRTLELSEGRYGLTAEAEDYLLESSPTYFGALLDLHVTGETLSYAAIDRAVATGSPQGASGDFGSFEAQAERAGHPRKGDSWLRRASRRSRRAAGSCFTRRSCTTTRSARPRSPRSTCRS